jgi:hypothetical protein
MTKRSEMPVDKEPSFEIDQQIGLIRKARIDMMVHGKQPFYDILNSTRQSEIERFLLTVEQSLIAAKLLSAKP